MTNAYIKSLFVPRKPRNGRVYGGDFNSISAPVYNSTTTGGQPLALPTKEVIGFSETLRPEITDYKTLYFDRFGHFPTVELYIEDDTGGRVKSYSVPFFTIVDGYITTIYFDLGTESTGFITISI